MSFLRTEYTIYGTGPVSKQSILNNANKDCCKESDKQTNFMIK